MVLKVLMGRNVRKTHTCTLVHCVAPHERQGRECLKIVRRGKESLHIQKPLPKSTCSPVGTLIFLTGVYDTLS